MDQETLKNKLRETLYNALTATSRNPLPMLVDTSKVINGVDDPVEVEWNVVEDWDIRLKAAELVLDLEFGEKMTPEDPQTETT